MNHVAGVAEAHDHPILHAAVALTGKIRDAGAEIERTRHIPHHISAQMKDAGVYGMAMPEDWGGPQLDPMTQLRVIEAIALGDGSAGWCAMINCDGGYYSAMLDQAAAREMYDDIQVATGGATTPTGTATPVEGGYIVRGRFPFISGVHNAGWVWLGCIVTQDGKPRLTRGGLPETRQCFVLPSQVEILDTWQTTGLRGTGSNDVMAHDVFVPAERTFSFQDPGVIKRAGPLYKTPRMYTVKAAAPALGIARHAIEIFIAQAKAKAARQHVYQGALETPKALSEETYVQEAVGRADALVLSARSHLFAVVGEFWRSLVEGRETTPLQVARLQSLYPHVVGQCGDAVRLVYRAAGASAIYQKGDLDRCFRDITTMEQHLIGSVRRYEAAGRSLLGLDPLTFLL